MNTKAKGTRNEHRSKKILEASGYRVTRAAASLGAWDLIGIKASGIVLVQCKTSRWLGSLERQHLQDFPAPPGTIKLVHRWDARKSEPSVIVI